MPRLVVAEKPSVARDISQVLGANSRQSGFFQGNGWLVTWCIGHLVELCEPHEYNPNWKRWSLPALPMIPNQFQLRPVSRTQAHYNIVERLLRRRDVSDVVNACDAGREGELIFRYVYHLANADKPLSRLWISSMTDEAISEGFANLRPGSAYDPLWDAARCRSEADWLVGLNATRAMTLRTREVVGPGRESPLLSVGRVQTPCLSMMVQRELTIRNFVPEDYWQLQGNFLAEAGAYQGRWFRLIDDPEDDSPGKKKQKQDNRLDKIEDAEALHQRLQGQDGVVIKVEKRRVTERPPLLFDLTRLQRTANKRFGFSAAKTLELAQALYEKHKLLTYPRTDSAFLSTDLIPKMRSTIDAVCLPPFDEFAQQILDQARIPAPKRIFNNAKVSDHHAIIPTERKPQLNRLSGDEGKLYDLVVRRFLAAFFPDAIFEKTSVITEVDGESFLTRGRVVVERAWRAVIGLPDHAGASGPPTRQSADSDDSDDDSDDDAHGVLPPLNEGDQVSLADLELQAKQTRPPPRFTEATLLAAMEGAGRQLEEEELQQAMKDSGLGTPATRASIIETLLRRKFVERRGKSMFPTEQGIHLICSIPVDSLKSPELTGEWEARMSRIARGEESAADFQTQVRQYLHETIDAIKSAPITALASFVQDNPPDAPGGGRYQQSDNGNGSNGNGNGQASSTKGKTTKSTRSKTTGGTSKSTSTRSTSSKSSKSSTSGTSKSTSSRGGTSKSASSTGTTGTTRKRAASTSDKAASKTTGTTRKSTNTKSSRAGAGTADMTSSSTSYNQQGQAEAAGSAERSAWRDNQHPQRSGNAASGSRSQGGAGQRQQTSTNAQSHQGRQQAPAQASKAPHQAHEQVQGSLGFCPRCHKGLMIWGKQAWGCDQWRQGCRTTIPYRVDGYDLSVKDALALLKGQDVGPLHGLRTNDGETYTGTLSLQHNADSTFLKNSSSE